MAKEPFSPPDDIQKKCDDFNAKYKVGTKGYIIMDNGYRNLTRTTRKAHVLTAFPHGGDHNVFIWLHGVSGGYLLDRFVIDDG